MCENLDLFGYSTFEEFIKDIETNPILVECIEMNDLSEMCEEIKPIKKSVRFSEEIIERKFSEPRENNICPEYNLPPSSEDISSMFCRNGMYLEDMEQKLNLIENNIFNNGGKVNDKELKKSTNIMTCNQIKLIKEHNKLNDIREIVTDYLTGDKGILNKVSETTLIDSVVYMMEVYEHLETDGTTYTFDYKSGVTISNREGKRQRDFLKTKIEFVTNKYL